MLMGCIADDFTGATDMALHLRHAGLSVVQTVGIPTAAEVPAVDAVVIALKSRTIPADDARRLSLEGLAVLQQLGAEHLFFKYCSTFDSTDDGNIGPVTEALMEALGEGHTIACPAFPTNGRTVYNGHMFVFDQLLSDSPMRNHPLTPMTDSNLVEVLQRQTRHKVGLANYQAIDQGIDATRESLHALAADGVNISIVDTLNNRHIDTLGAAVQDMTFVTGGSAIGGGIARAWIKAGRTGSKADIQAFQFPKGHAAVLAGSCSAATRAQVALAKRSMPWFKLDAGRLMNGDDPVDEVLNWAAGKVDAGPILVYSSDEPEIIKSLEREHGRETTGSRVEQAIADIARGLHAMNVTRWVVAGGETSGAVVQALDVSIVNIGEEIDPGVPWTISGGDTPVALALKSGNFGAEDFFAKALSKIR